MYYCLINIVNIKILNLNFYSKTAYYPLNIVKNIDNCVALCWLILSVPAQFNILVSWRPLSIKYFHVVCKNISCQKSQICESTEKLLFILLLPGQIIIISELLSKPWQWISEASIWENSQRNRLQGCSSLCGTPDKARAPICLNLSSLHSLTAQSRIKRRSFIWLKISPIV